MVSRRRWLRWSATCTTSRVRAICIWPTLEAIDRKILLRIASLVGLRASSDIKTEQSREQVRLFVRAYLQGAGTPTALLTMAAAQLNLSLNRGVERQETVWLQPVHVRGQLPTYIRLEENPLYRVERQPVLAKTGTRWTVDNPGMLHDGLLRPEIAIEALVDEVRGPSLVLEDIGIAWLSPGIVLQRGDRLVLATAADRSFIATLHNQYGAHDVTEFIEVIGSMPDESQLALGVSLSGGDDTRPASALLRARDGVQVVRFCARTSGNWGNGLTLGVTGSRPHEKLRVSHDPVLAATGLPGTAGTRITEWELDMPGGLLPGSLETLTAGRFLMEAEDATLFLPVGRSRWIYFDHLAVQQSDVADLEFLARLILDYTRFGKSAYHDVDNFDVFRFDRDDALFGDANYTTEEEQVRITISWREPRPTSIRLEVPPSLVEDSNPQITSRRYELLAEGVKRIKPAGVSASIVRSLPDERLVLKESLELDRVASFDESTNMSAQLLPASRVVNLEEHHIAIAAPSSQKRATRFSEQMPLRVHRAAAIASSESVQYSAAVGAQIGLESVPSVNAGVSANIQSDELVNATGVAVGSPIFASTVTAHARTAGEVSQQVAAQAVTAAALDATHEARIAGETAPTAEAEITTDIASADPVVEAQVGLASQVEADAHRDAQGTSQRTTSISSASENTREVAYSVTVRTDPNDDDLSSA